MASKTSDAPVREGMQTRGSGRPVEQPSASEPTSQDEKSLRQLIQLITGLSTSMEELKLEIRSSAKSLAEMQRDQLAVHVRLEATEVRCNDNEASIVVLKNHVDNSVIPEVETLLAKMHVKIQQEVEVRLKATEESLEKMVASTSGRQYKLTFKINGIDEEKHGAQLAESIEAIVAEKLGVRITITDAVRLGNKPTDGKPRRVLFVVSSVWEAKELVRNRSKLKGSGTSILDEFSPEELLQHKKMWPAFTAARADGKKAFFQRARLFVDGKEVVG